MSYYPKHQLSIAGNRESEWPDSALYPASGCLLPRLSTCNSKGGVRV